MNADCKDTYVYGFREVPALPSLVKKVHPRKSRTLQFSSELSGQLTARRGTCEKDLHVSIIQSMRDKW